MRSLKPILYLSLLCAVPTAWAENEEKFHSETNVERSPDGSFERTIKKESTDAAGTKVKEVTTQKSQPTLTGGNKMVTKKEVVQDPRGILNQSSETREVTSTADKDGDYEQTSSATTQNADGTKLSTTEKIAIDYNSDGSKKTTTTSKKVIDPKGLMNKKTLETENVVKEQLDGTVTTSRQEKVNGDVVKEEKHGQ